MTDEYGDEQAAQRLADMFGTSNVHSTLMPGYYAHVFEFERPVCGCRINSIVCDFKDGVLEATTCGVFKKDCPDHAHLLEDEAYTELGV